MKDILLVDDEYAIRKALKSLIDWEGNGFNIAGEAPDGAKALDIICKYNIDILITDMKMPVMDGLELIRQTMEFKNNIKVVVLSSYDDFSLVRNAFKLGACDYFLKTEMDPGKIIETCKRLEKELEDEKREKEFLEKQKQLEKKLHQNRNVLKDRFLKDIVLERCTEPYIIEQEKQNLDLRLKRGNLVVMVACVDNYKTVLEEWDGDRDLFSFSFMNVMEEILSQHETGDAFCIAPDEYGIIFSYREAVSLSDIRNKTSILFHELSKNFSKYLNIDLSAGLSRKGNDYCSLSRLYSQANAACRYRLISGKGKLILYDEATANPINNDFKKSDRIEYLKKTLQSMDTGAIKKVASFLCIPDTGISLEDISSIKGIFEKYTWVLIDFIEKNGLTQKCETLLQRYYRDLWNTGSVKELNQWLSDVLSVISESLTVGNQYAKSARQFVHKHFYEDISLASVADELHVSTGYLSRLFLKELGCNFIDYLNSYRIEKAKEYIKNGNMKVYEISEKVGYSNVEHFGRVFKKVVGKSPKEFACICRQEADDQ